MPGEADWLIWERDGEKFRLCKMHDGKWSVVRDAPCAYVPGVIVVNNDENIVKSVTAGGASCATRA